MKALLKKKFMIVLAAVILFISTKAQMPNKLKDLPAFKLRALVFTSLQKQHLQDKLNTGIAAITHLALTNKIL